jgi:hypothetical protein
MDAIAADLPVAVTGDPVGGVVPGEDIVEQAPEPTSSASPTIAPEGPTVVELPSSIQGQAATQQTCTAGQTF